jgi:predicted dehydrogenase
MPKSNRRDFLKSATATAATLAATNTLFAQPAPPASPGERIIVAVMGTGSRGTQLATTLASLPNVFVKYVCDVDDAAAGAAAKVIAKKAEANNNTPAPTPIRQYQQILDDKEIFAMAVATPDHWHAPAAILGVTAGKHVYVEKPCCHNPHEGELLVTAQKKYDRVIQHGSQRRSYPKNIEAIAKLKEGVIGKVLFSRGWYNNNRPPIGKGKPAAVPATFDWTLWQGPAPQREFHDNYVPYNWHWFWDWGTGECGNNGIHSLDICRWGLGVDCPAKVTSAGGRYHYDDDWQTPDTQFVTFDFGDKVIQWEGRSCHPRGIENNNSGFGAAFYGDKGSLVIDAGNYAIYDLKNKEVAKVTGPGAEAPHMQNFLDAAKLNDQSKLNAPIAEGYASVLLCHLANISQRAGRTIHMDTATKKIKDDPEAAKLWSREYRPGWEPKV